MAKLQEIYVDEMRSRVEKLRLSIALSGAIDERARVSALYDAHLQAHTIKGTSQQLKYEEAAFLGAAMSDALEAAREAKQVTRPVAAAVERGCNALLAWLDGGLATPRPLVVAAASFSVAREQAS